MINSKSICLGCMEDKGEAKTCPHCGYVEGAGPESLLHLPPGMVLQNKYLIGKAIGQGGFGITYLAWDLNLDLKLAVKEFFPQRTVSRLPGNSQVISTDREVKGQFVFGLERFINEAKILARFENHPNIVTVRDYFRANNTAYMVMNYIKGLTLEQYLIDVGGRVSFSKAFEIILPVMDALKEIHVVGLLHRDISPDNILLDDKGRIVLIDFGAALQEVKESSKSLTAIFKAGYAPEEQYRRRGRQGPWTDVYAVGATLYRMICGEPPPEAIDRLVEDTIIAPSKLGVEINFEMEECLRKALAVNMEDRYPTMDRFQKALIGYSDKLPDYMAEVCSSCYSTPIAKPLKTSDELCAIGIASSTPGRELNPSVESENGRQLPARIGKVRGIIAVGILVFLIAAIMFYSTSFKKNEEINVNPLINDAQQEETSARLIMVDGTGGLRGNYVGNIINAGYAAWQGNYIYYHNDFQNGKIYKYNLGNNQNEGLNDYSSWSINVYGDYIIFSNQDRDYRIYSLKTDGSEQRQLNDDYSSNINVVNDWIFYRNWDDGNSIYKIRLDGTERTKINNDSSWHINVVGNWIYYRNQDDGNTIYRIRENGSERSRLNNDRSWFINVVDNHIYYCNEDDGWKIYKLNLDGTNKLILNNDHAGYLNVVESRIYYVNRSDENKIYRIDLDGNNRSRINDDDSCCINVVGDWIYYKNMVAGEKLYRIKVDGTNRETVN